MEKTIEIRRMRIGELEEVQELYARQVEADDNPLTALTCNEKKHAWEMRRIRQQLLTEQRYLAFVAIAHEADGSTKLVGYTAAVLEQQSRLLAVDTVAAIDELWVLPNWRRHGIGKNLMDALFESIQMLGIDWVRVHFPENAEDVRSFFEKRGFKQRSVEMQRQI